MNKPDLDTQQMLIMEFCKDDHQFWKRMEEGGPKSFRFEELSGSYFVPSSGGTALHYLKCLDKDLRERSEKSDPQ